jgi:hypothetical protein
MYVTNNILSSVDATGSAYHSLKPIDTSTSITVGITRYIGELERDQAFIRGRSQAKLPPTLAQWGHDRSAPTHQGLPYFRGRPDKPAPLVDSGIHSANPYSSATPPTHIPGLTGPRDNSQC